MSIPKDPKSSHFKPSSTISNIKAAEKPRPAAEIKPQPKVEDNKNVDKSKLSGEKDEKSNAPKLGALMENLGDKKNEKADNKPKTPQEQKKQLDTLKDQLKKAQASGNKEEIAKLEAEIKKLEEALKGGAQPGAENPSGSNSGGGSNPGGGSPAGSTSPGGGSPGGGSPGAGAPAGGSPAGGSPAGGSPAGGSPAGGANEAGAGQGAGAGKEEVDQFIQKAASAYGVNPQLLSEIARRESNFNTGDVANNWDSNAKKGTPSKGMFQFIEPTFKSMAPQAKAANPGAWQGVSENWTDWRAQALTTAWAISSGKGSHWSTYKSALASAGGNPRGPSAVA